MRPPKATRVPARSRARRAACGMPANSPSWMFMNQKQSASVSASDASSGRRTSCSGRAESGTTTQAADAAPAASAASQRLAADVRERLVDERLEALSWARRRGTAPRSRRRRGCSRCGDLLREVRAGRRRGARPDRRRAAIRPRRDRSRRRRAGPSRELAHERGARAAGASPRSGPAGAAARTSSRATGSRSASGHALAARHARQADRAPRSKSAWFQSPGAAARRRRPRWSPSARSSTRRTLVSSAVTWAPNAKHAMRPRGVRADAGQRSSSAISRGNPPGSATRLRPSAG